ncbi:2OG-Fe(II) oxygenase [Roseovarius faecimaris]|uniref:2OG-Fe(II) oxygenase n=1 Tax=Roseovarius faecimaris TaxID=2494550 RepID=A0A6I6IYM6_9RHOB|nr:2OG-Fe(II) oxygenase [Roseovarius faecimaris]QGX97708.1 2OG-Fe(II) oxygenase [Roseovarius faecimaris]
MRDILDLERYPLDRPDSVGWSDLVNQCQADLAREGMFNLHGLMRADVAAQEVARLSSKFATESFRHEREHNIYFLDHIDGLPDDHPALRRTHTSNQTLCADQIGASALTRLYEWPEFTRFLAATMGRSALHTMSDPLARINVMSYHEGQTLNWHFDRSEFTTTLLLQAPEAGGAFEYRTDLRSEEDPNYDGVARLLRGEDPEARILTLSPGTLNVFKGKNTPHRVTKVQGKRDRVIAVFSYYDRPGVQFSEAERIGFYGRAS